MSKFESGYVESLVLPLALGQSLFVALTFKDRKTCLFVSTATVIKKFSRGKRGKWGKGNGKLRSDFLLEGRDMVENRLSVNCNWIIL